MLQTKNRAYSYLAGGMGLADSTLTLVSGGGSNFPLAYPFHLTIGTEIVECTGRASDDVLQITRAAEGTTATTHVSGEMVSLNVTAGVIQDIQAGRISTIMSVFNVKDYGAVGDNVTDDAAACQAALTAGAGRIVFFPAGTYFVSTALLFSTGTIIIGEGVSTVVRANLTNNAVFKSSRGASARAYRVVFRDIKVDGSSQANVGSVGIDLYNVSQARLFNVFVNNAETGVRIDAPAWPQAALYNTLIDVEVGAADVGFLINNASNENRLINCRCNYCGIGVRIDNGSNNNALDHFCCEHFDTAIELGATERGTLIFAPRIKSPNASGVGISIGGWGSQTIVKPYFSGVAQNLQIVSDPGAFVFSNGMRMVKTEVVAGGTFILPQVEGFYFIIDMTAKAGALEYVRTATGAKSVTELLDPVAIFTNTKDSANKINVYWDTDNFYVQNGYAVSHYIGYTLIADSLGI